MNRANSYTIGFLHSLIFTIVAFELVNHNVLHGTALAAAILGLAFAQFCVQLIFFLPLAQEPKPYWNLQIFVSAILLIAMVIGASLWIMNNLKYRHESAEEGTNYILKSEGIHR